MTGAEALAVMLKAGADKGHTMAHKHQGSPNAVKIGCLRCNATWFSIANHVGDHPISTMMFFENPDLDPTCPATGRTADD